MLPEQEQHILKFTEETNKQNVMSKNADKSQEQITTFDMAVDAQVSSAILADIEDEFNALFSVDGEEESSQPSESAWLELDIEPQNSPQNSIIVQRDSEATDQLADDKSLDFDNLFNNEDIQIVSTEPDFDALFTTEEVQNSAEQQEFDNLTHQYQAESVLLSTNTDIHFDEIDIASQQATQIDLDSNNFDKKQEIETAIYQNLETEANENSEIETTLEVSGSVEYSHAPAEINSALETVIEFFPVFEEPSTANTLETAEFDDLDALLETESEAIASTEHDAFDDLDALLDDSTVIETAEFDDLDALLETEIASEADELAALDALLETESEAITSTEHDAFDDLDALLEDKNESEAIASTEYDEFDDLDALLEESTPVKTADEFAALDALLDEDIKRVATADSNTNADLDALLGDTQTTELPKKPATKPSASAPRKTAFEQTMRVPVKHLDDVGNLVGELVVNRNSLEQDQERLRQFTENLLHRVQQLNELGVRMQELYERSLLEASLISSRQGSSRTVVVENNNSERHATGMDFDALEMDRFTGFHTLSQEMIEMIVRVRESASDIEFVTDETEIVARQFRQVTTQLQEGMTRSRMIPFSQIADRLPRAVKEITLKYGKQAELEIDGRDTLIDKVILEQLYDPMTHLVNNSITHGIETPEERIANGKPAAGKITIRAFHQGNQTVISVTDDGAGIDPDRVLTKAIQKGLITVAEARTMSRMDVYNLLFHPGFSTKEQVDEFAGRGVGMDVVRTSLNEIRGIITTDSVLGKGTTFTIRLPLTLSICKALSCLSDKARIAFPMDGVEDMMDIPASSLVMEEGKPCVAWRDSILPLRPLKELINYNRVLGRGNVYGNKREDDLISVVILRSAGTYLALQVDQVLGEQEIVIKQFEAPVPKPIGIAGATIMGDGRVMPIADVLELIDLALGRIQHNDLLWTTSATLIRPETPEATKSEPTVLIVDDSITVRELLSMTFSKAGYRVEQARDGQEAWDKMRDGLPCDLVFCDIEMPRMDGLELLSRLQKDPSLCKIPIAMLTSRGAERHRKMAIQLGASGYFTKPYLEEVLLEGANKMLNGEMLVVRGEG